MRRSLNRRLARRTAPLAAADLAEPAIVVAPHPDDETLGCGGLIVAKREAAAQVDVVFMTDGAASHAQLVDQDRLSAERRREALAACAVLGVPADNVHFLPYRDGRLAESFDDATERLAELVAESPATQIILPHPEEPPSDHHVTYRVAEAALATRPEGMVALLYPVWLWDQWPWTNPLSAPRVRHSTKQVLGVAARGGLGFRAVRHWTHHVDLGPLIDRKSAALRAHRTQMSNEGRPEGWLTLPDVANGEWLGQILGGYEYYARRHLGNPVLTRRMMVP